MSDDDAFEEYWPATPEETAAPVVITRNMLLLLLRKFFWPVCLGLLIGTAATAVSSQVLRRALDGISNLDFVGYAGAIAFLLTTLVIATLLPGRRTFKLNVLKALRYG